MATRNPNGISASAGPPTNVTIVLDEEVEEETELYKQRMWTMVTREARAVSVWALIAPLIRLVLEPLISQACVATEETCQPSNISALAGWLLSLFPPAVAKNLAPGFVFASAWCVGELYSCCVCVQIDSFHFTHFLDSGSCLLSVINLESFQTCLFAYVKPSWVD